MGISSTASGSEATAIGTNVTASGTYATATGDATTANTYDSFVMGTYNVGGGNATTWVATDPLFEIGNGTSSSAKLDAVVVYKNGSMTVQGPITAAAGGDIPMFTGY
jgi:hypothetical protein